MHLLVSTPLQILLLDLSSGASSLLRAGDGYYFGLTYGEDTVVLSHSAGYLVYYPPAGPSFQSETHLLQPHQIEWVDDCILAANTGRNCLTVFDRRGRLLRDVFFNPIHYDDKDHGRLGNHFNSVHRAGERVYVVAHNYENPSAVWELDWPGLNVLDQKVTRAAWAHNLWSGDLGLVICDSRHGGLYEVLSQETVWRSDDPVAFTRGLAVSRDYLFVGCSQYQERRERYWKTGRIWVIERKSLNKIAEFPLPGSGDIQDLRLVGEADECHNGQVIPLDGLSRIRWAAPWVGFAYRLRRKHPSLQRDLLPISASVRLVQRWMHWKKNISRSSAKFI